MLNPSLPQDTLVAFLHPSGINNYVFIGGEMPHWIKRVVNGLENSGKQGHKRNLLLNGQSLRLDMIRRAWEDVEMGGISTLRQTKLTIDHFVKNPHSRMRVFLSVQILSSSVHELLWKYVDGNDELTVKYSSLMSIVLMLDRLIDIWNHPDSKGFECINSPNHQYIDELESILLIFSKWKNATI